MKENTDNSPENSALKLSDIMAITRPHFWVYEFGTYILGIAAAVSLTASGYITTAVPWGQVFIFGIYFLIPANLFIYGINDIFDFETDRRNPKKDNYELRVYPTQHKKLWWWIIGANAPFVIAAPLISISADSLLSLLLFLFFAGFYSAPPIRAKNSPGIDSFFSGAHYVATGVFGYLLVGGAAIIWPLVIAGICWTMAMHAYSAVPDIEADAASDTNTVAVALGAQKTIYLCAALYAAAGILLATFASSWLLLLTLPYLGLMWVSLKKSAGDELLKVYSWFPYINTVVGGVLFFTALLG